MIEWREDYLEWRAWLRDHRRAALAVFLFSLFVFGQRLVYHDIGIDSETLFDGLGLNEYMRVWCSTGRYGLVLTKRLFGFAHGIPFAANALGVMLLWAAVTMLSFLVYGWSRGTVDSRVFYPVFAAMFLSSPILTEQFCFTLQTMEIAWALICCLLASYFAAKLAYRPKDALAETASHLTLGLWNAVPALCLMIWAFGTYQAFVVVYVMLILISYLLVYLWSEGEKREISWFLAGCKQLALFLAGLFGWWFIHKLLCHFLFQELSYTSNMIQWKINPAGCIAVIKEDFLRMVTSSIFFYQKLFVPVLALALALMLLQAKRLGRRRPWCFLLAILCFAVSPMLLTLVTGGGFPMRSRIYYPLAEGFVFAYSAASLWQLGAGRRRALSVLFVFLIAVCCWKQTGRSMALQETAHLAFQGDCHLMNRIAARMEQKAGRRLGELPTIFVGKLSPDLSEDCLRGEVIGHSFFDWDAGRNATGNHRIFGLAVLMGIELAGATDEQKSQAVEYAKEMPPWPAEESVQVKGGLLIVKLSSPEKTENRWWYSGGWHYWINNFSTILKSDWKEIDESWYYFDSRGNMVTGQQEIDGEIYHFDLDGKWID